MTEITLEAIVKRLEAVEKKLAEKETEQLGRKKDWRHVAGMFTGSDFMKQVDAEGQAIREADRKAAQEGRTE